LFPDFRDTPARQIRDRLVGFASTTGDVDAAQIRAWDASIPPLQREVAEVLARIRAAREFSTLLEYELPLESRRPDVVLLLSSSVAVIELKGKTEPTLADIDQAAAYARDLSCYHAACESVPVTPVLVPTRAKGDLGTRLGVRVVGPDILDHVIGELCDPGVQPISREQFLAADAYRPLPTIVEAARELFETRELRYIKRARAATEPAVQRLTEIVCEAERTRTRRLVLLTGIPGAGKTLVGLQLVHARFLDALAQPRAGRQPTAPAVFLSGNRPLVAVLQYQLRNAGGGGKTFVRHVFDYVKSHTRGRTPSEHVLVFDEAQRAFDATQVDAKHRVEAGLSEPDLFVEFADRIPGWCVVVGLIGSGQEIHVGEEGGLAQWRRAVERSAQRDHWQIHAPGPALVRLESAAVPTCDEPVLNLDLELRQHRARDLHQFVAGVLAAEPARELRALSDRLATETFQLRLTRNLAAAERYLRDRFDGDPLARFGLLASSRDKDLEAFGVPNGYRETSRVHAGPWYSDDGPQSCRALRSCVTEFGAQGLELDAVLLAWGTDLRLVDGRWSTDRARKYKKASQVRDARQLRINAYRVLLTRARDVCIVFVPPMAELDETFNYLRECGFVVVDDPSA
jgi:hypothetical protein